MSTLGDTGVDIGTKMPREGKSQSGIYHRRLRYSLLITISQMLLIAMAICWGIHLVLIAQNGGVFAIEKNPFVLYGEIVATVFIVAFAVLIILLEFMRMRSRRRSDVDERKSR